MKRASYREGVAWIAANDEPMSRSAEEIAGFISSLLLADLFHVEPARVGADVLRLRVRQDKREKCAWRTTRRST